MDEQQQAPPTPSTQPQVEQQQWQYSSGQLEQQGVIGDVEAPVSDEHDSGLTVSWTASEFVSHEKTGGWYAILIAGSVILGLLIFLLTREWFSLVAVAVLAVAVGMFANLRPRVLNYSINQDGIMVGEKHFNFGEFRSFAIIEEGALPSLQLLPQKRFMMSITLYLDPAQGEHIVDVLGEYLPFEHRERDFVDRLSTRIRF